MTDRPWYESYFGEDYLEIHRDDLTEDLSRRQVDNLVSLLGLRPGARILDLACGHGRHAIELAKLGFEVTGYDLSEVFLGRASADADRVGVDVRWIQGDMRELAFDAEFDVVLNVFSAFGYFEDPDDDLRTLQAVRTALVPGGRFLLETIHRDALPAKFRPREWAGTSTGSIVLRERSWDLATDLMHEDVTLIRSNGVRTKHHFTVRMRSLSAYLGLLRTADLEPSAWHGGFDGRPLELDSWRLVVISQRGTSV